MVYSGLHLCTHMLTFGVSDGWGVYSLYINLPLGVVVDGGYLHFPLHLCLHINSALGVVVVGGVYYYSISLPIVFTGKYRYLWCCRFVGLKETVVVEGGLLHIHVNYVLWACSCLRGSGGWWWPTPYPSGSGCRESTPSQSELHYGR